jgi:aldehyde:ferredoxin oxidoreductase
VFSPLVGTPLTTSAKFAVVAKSPLTERLNDALASSHFAIAGKLSGNDALVVRGRATRPRLLLVDGDGARVQDAADLWGLPPPRPRRGCANGSARRGGSRRSVRRRAARTLRDRLP